MFQFQPRGKKNHQAVFLFNDSTLLGFKSTETLSYPVPFPLVGSDKLVVKMQTGQQLISGNGHYTNEKSLILFHLFIKSPFILILLK